MSREDLVFTRRSIVVVAVLSALGGPLLGGFVAAWRLRDREEALAARFEATATVAAVAAAEKAVGPVLLELREHKAADVAETKAISDRVGRVEKRVGLDDLYHPERGATATDVVR